jgi:hypothetical protein
MHSDATVDLFALDAELTTYINYGPPPVVPGNLASHETMPIQVGNDTVVLPRFTTSHTSRHSAVTRRPSDNQLALLALVSLLTVGALVLGVALVIH